jgi:hypothetical protein
MTLHRPEPIQQHQASAVSRSHSARRAAEQLRDGETLIVSDAYGTGAEILDQLQRLMPAPTPAASFGDRQAARRAHRAASLRLLAPIRNHRVALDDAREVGFLRVLYPELPTFTLPFVEVQELHGAWHRFQIGTRLAVLGHTIHPFYGTYVPSRTSHLELFGTWISQYTGPRTRAIDVGTGCGVLALMLCKAGVERVLATDNNPNAIESVRRQLKHLTPSPPIDLDCCDLLGDGTVLVDLIVFNPPWMRGEMDGLLDTALYFTDGLFERFFDQSIDRLARHGRIVLVFSNVIQLVQPDVPHPIQAELDRGRLRLVQKLQRKVKPGQDARGKRRRTKERVEIWELAHADGSTSS